ncbi:hypothetical protein ACLOJK_039697 [Asimina triloba]
MQKESIKTLSSEKKTRSDAGAARKNRFGQIAGGLFRVSVLFFLQTPFLLQSPAQPTVGKRGDDGTVAAALGSRRSGGKRASGSAGLWLSAVAGGRSARQRQTEGRFGGSNRERFGRFLQINLDRVDLDLFTRRLSTSGKLPEGQEIAVKRLSRSSGQGPEEFKNEAWELWKEGRSVELIDPILLDDLSPSSTTEIPNTPPEHQFRCSIVFSKTGSHGCRRRAPAGYADGRSKPPKMSRMTC